MFKTLIKNIILITLPIITLSSDFAHVTKNLTENKANIEVENQDNKQSINQDTISLEEIDKNFENFQSFEDSKTRESVLKSIWDRWVC